MLNLILLVPTLMAREYALESFFRFQGRSLLFSPTHTYLPVLQN